MHIIPYSSDRRNDWDNFVLRSNNGTMFHMQRFLEYHQPGKFDFENLMFIDKGNIVGVLPGAVVDDAVFESPIGASYGSIVTPDLTFEAAMAYVSELIEYGKQTGYKRLRLTPPPLIYETYPNQDLEFAMLWQGFEYELHYISSAIYLDPNRELIPRFQSTVRRNIRKTLKDPDIRVEINQRYEEFYPILVENKAKHGVKPTHSLDDLHRLVQLLPENLKLFMVYHKNEPIGGSLMFFCNRNVALCFYNMLRYEFAEYKPIHRVMYEVVKYSGEMGYKYVDIGVSQDTSAENPMTPSTGLIQFKEKFDAKTTMRNTLIYTL